MVSRGPFLILSKLAGSVATKDIPDALLPMKIYVNNLQNYRN